MVEPPESGPRLDRPVDLVVPVFGAAEAFERCLASLAAATDLSHHRLVVVADGPQDAATEAVLATVGEAPRRGAILRLPGRQGFAAAVNAAAALSEHDLVLLNSDTQVTDGWLARLAAVAQGAPRIATVTPFSNAATIASLPRWLADNLLPAGHTVASFGELVERSSRRLAPAIPTGVGACLYVRRAAWIAAGPFDAEQFGLGYGEEVDFCLRAAALGWEHRLDDSTFVFHEGQASFGATRGRRVRRAERRIERRHPGYRRRLAAFLAADPLAAARAPILAALAPTSTLRTPRPPLAVVHVVHGWPPFAHGGTEHYAARLAHAQSDARAVVAYARVARPEREEGATLEWLDGATRVRLLVRNFRERDPRSRNAIASRFVERDFARLLAEVRPGLVHVHHLAGHALSLARVAARRGIPLVWQLQDWWGLCARANLLDRERRLCPGPAPGRCSRCLPLTEVAPRALANRWLYAARARAARRALANASALVAGSRSVVESYRAAGWIAAETTVHVLDYGVDSPRPAAHRQRAGGEPLRLGFVGSILPHKGLHVLAAALARLPPGNATLIVWGDAEHDPAYTREVRREAGEAAIDFRGRFAEQDKDRVFAELDLVVVPSLGLESYGFVAREALARGLPVVASRRGALAELFGGAVEGRGVLFDPERPEELAAWLRRAHDDPTLLPRWRAAASPVACFAAHVEAIDAVYAEVLARAGRR
ncbi:MAG: glycosyltransferase [Thermoanaerobaculia bacterium]